MPLMAELPVDIDDIEVWQAHENFHAGRGKGVLKAAGRAEGLLIEDFDGGAAIHGKKLDVVGHRVLLLEKKVSEIS